jgi:hypothetical protein
MCAMVFDRYGVVPACWLRNGVRDSHVVGHAVLDRCGDLGEFVP